MIMPNTSTYHLPAAPFARLQPDVPIARRPWWRPALLGVGGSLLALVIVVSTTSVASAAPTDVNLATATPFAVLAGSTISNTGPTTIAGSVGLSPGSAVTGFPPGIVTAGTTHVADAVALQAKNDLTAAFVDAAARTPFSTTTSDLAGQNLVPGVYKAPSSMGLTGSVTLNGGGDANAVFIFIAGSTLITSSSSRVVLTNATQACHIYWVVGSSATLGTGSNFVGTILSLTSITATSGVTVDGRLLARNGAVTLDDDVITRPLCSTVATTTVPGGGTTTVPGGGTTTVPGGSTIPHGAPGTGFGGALPRTHPLLLWGAGVAAAAAVVTASVATRRQRVLRRASNRSE